NHTFNTVTGFYLNQFLFLPLVHIPDEAEARPRSCCAVLCCAVLCCAVLCCAVLRCAGLGWNGMGLGTQGECGQVTKATFSSHRVSPARGIGMCGGGVQPGLRQY